jgi:3-oxoacyl-[acyl-carrier-protein] synthase-1
MRNVYVVADNIFSPLGKDTLSNMEALKKGRSGIEFHKTNISPEPFYASLFSPEEKTDEESITFFERIVINSALDVLQQTDFDPGNKKNGFILSNERQYKSHRKFT